VAPIDKRDAEIARGVAAPGVQLGANAQSAAIHTILLPSFDRFIVIVSTDKEVSHG
jgi:hypothetical protein